MTREPPRDHFVHSPIPSYYGLPHLSPSPCPKCPNHPGQAFTGDGSGFLASWLSYLECPDHHGHVIIPVLGPKCHKPIAHKDAEPSFLPEFGIKY